MDECSVGKAKGVAPSPKRKELDYLRFAGDRIKSLNYFVTPWQRSDDDLD